MSDLKNISKEYKKIRNKNSYMKIFLERRKQAADFALKGKNKSGYKYTKPNFYINDGKEKEINKYQKKNPYETTSNDEDDKNKYFKTYSSYSTLKKNYKINNKSINMIFIEEEKNKYYLSDGIPKSSKNSKYGKMNGQLNPYYKQKNDQINNININKYTYFEKSNEEYQELIDGLLTEEEINQQFNDINHHSITFSSKNRNYKNKNKNKENINENEASSPKEIFSEFDKNELWNNHIKKQNKKNNYNCNNKKNEVTSPNIKAKFGKNNKNGLFYNNTDINRINKYKSKSSIRVKQHLNLNLISSGKESECNKTNINEDNKNIYYEGVDNHKFYISTKTNEFKNSCEPNKAKNKTENKNEKLNSRSNIEQYKNKKIYKIKNDNDINKRSKIEKNQINDISPIRTLCRYNYEDYNDFKNIEKIIESKSIIGNSDTNSNIKLRNNIKKPSSFSNDKKNLNAINYNIKELTTRSFDQLKHYSSKVLKDAGNTKTISIVCKSQEIQKINKGENNIKIIQYSNKRNEDINVNKTNNDNNDNVYFLNDKNISNKNIYNCQQINYSVNNNSGNDLLKEEETKMKTNQSPQNIEKIPENVNANDILNNFHQVSNKIINTEKNDNNFLKIIDNQIDNYIKHDNIKENQELNNILNNNIKIESKMQNYNNNDFEECSNIDEEQDNEIIKDRYESFLKQKDEKEPNLQSKIFNSMITSKDDSYLINTNNNLIKNIQDTIKILKNNISKNKNKDLDKNYINEIDNYFNKIKQKEEKNNSTLNEYYLGLNINNNKKNNQEIENNNIIEKKVMIPRSLRLQNMVKQNSYYKKYKVNGKKNYNTNTNIKYEKFSPSQTCNPKQLKKSIHLKEIDIKNNFNYIKLSKYKHNPVPSINLIVDEANYENTKIMDENDYFKLKKKNIKTTRSNLTINPLKSEHLYSYRNGFDLHGCKKYVNKRSTFKFGSKINAYSSRIILSDINNKIMPPNEI